MLSRVDYRTRLRRLMRRPIWGRVIGSGVGLTAGPFGLGFGFLVGYLIDHLRMQRRSSVELIRFLGPSSQPLTSADLERTLGLPIMVTAFIGLGVRVLSADGLLRDFHLGVIQRELRMRYPFPAGRARQLELVMREAIILGTRIDIARIGDVLQKESDKRREELLRALLVLSQADGIEVSPERIQILEATGKALCLSESFVTAELRPHRRLNSEACALLGVDSQVSMPELRKVYRRLAAEFHPDLAMELSDEQRQMTNEAFVRIQAAYRTLCRELGNEE